MPHLDPRDICFCPLHTPVFHLLVVRWFTNEYETEVLTRRRICCRRPTEDRYVNGILAPPILEPFVFELIGQIAEYDCHLTVDGHGDRTEAPVASCWIEACPDQVSRIEWAQSIVSLNRIIDTIREPVCPDELAFEGNPIRYQLFFEPPEGRTVCARTLPRGDQDKFRNQWNASAKTHLTSWKKSRKSQSTFEPQLKFNSQCTAYTEALWDRVQPTSSGGEWAALPADWPAYGPRFYPPTFGQYQLRQVASDCDPEWAYIKVLMVIHQVYFPFVMRCPNCHSRNTKPNGWTSTGHREVHGLSAEECVIGVQFRCKDCEARRRSGGDLDATYCYSTTSPEFWQKMSLWEIPRGVPHFFHRTAVTSELFDFIVESRLSENSAAIAEHVKQFHLLEYHRRRLEYLQAFQARSKQMSLRKKPDLRNFSAPQRAGKDLNGYDGTSITDNLVGDVYARFSVARQKECEEHLRTLTATTLSLDATFRAASKASFVNDDRSRSSIFNGGLHTAVNQKSLIISYRWCMTLLHSEIGDMLLGMKKRFELLNVDNPWAVVVDNCCHFRNMILKVFPETAVLQDVWHLIMRYMICVLGGTKNPHRREVAEDIAGAIIKTKAHDGIPARYWSQEEQEERLVEAFKKWVVVGGVWNAAAEKAHHEQLEHVRKGCLARPREDIATDGSRIEGTHKGWNSLQRTHPSGVEVLTALAADHVLRHNIRVDYASPDPFSFTASTFGSHHIHLVNACAQLWNALLEPANRGERRHPADLFPAPTLQPAASEETFGLVKASSDVTAYHSFVTVKEEHNDSLINLSTEDPDEAERIMRSLGLDPSLLHKPLEHDRSQSQAPSGRSTIAFVPAALEMDETMDVGTTSGPSDRPPSQPSRPSTVPGSPKKRHTSTALSRAHEDPTTPSNASDKRTRTLQSDAPSSSAPFVSIAMPAASPSSSTLLGPVAGPSSMSAVAAASLAQRLPSIFYQCRLATPDPTAVPICLPIPIISGTTCSQILISLVTGLDPRSLKFSNDDDEFYMFMDLRATYKWVTYNILALTWVEAASIFNAALEKKRGKDAVRKTPRALMEKLEDIEKTIHFRIKNKDFKSRSGTTSFWEKHCLAVDLSWGSKRGKGKGKQIAPAKPITQKPNTCHRCLSIMWAQGEGGSENHKKGYCSDGVKQKAASVDGVIEELPPWPQPNDIFTKGTHFWPKRFARTVRDLYDTVTDGDRLGGPRAMEFQAFAEMLRARLIVIPATDTQPSCVRFKLYRGLELGEQPTNPSDVVTVEGAKYLHVTYLSESGFQEVAALG
ncbi:hypothetical protein GSI_11072 [Ganoderma sinense ZZ0214-1]|uniref:Uncharacterized protein n=1 Tax=Ganoderma sinense ZZ0214-1 TaxID=1077348 RepID=A0A2G8RZ69_9APHY|nr:hypothetical protein GSI_11072 [Ganoderma sinense ZZ0214-1]